MIRIAKKLKEQKNVYMMSRGGILKQVGMVLTLAYTIGQRQLVVAELQVDAVFCVALEITPRGRARRFVVHAQAVVRAPVDADVRHCNFCAGTGQGQADAPWIGNGEVGQADVVLLAALDAPLHDGNVFALSTKVKVGATDRHHGGQ